MIDRRILDRRLAGLEIGSAEWFAAQRAMIEAKPLVKRCYELWYSLLLEDVQSTPSESASCRVVELGSGGSFIKELAPQIITSDVRAGDVDMVLDGRELPFRSSSIRALLLTHVFHHIPDVRGFLVEAERVLVPGGVISIVDETHTPFARMFFSLFHPEPYNDRARDWSFPAGNTILDSNQALSWIVFFRDSADLREVAPTLVLERWQYLPWLSYLLSGGVNLPSFVPKPFVRITRALDFALHPLDRFFAIHWHLTIRKHATVHR